MYKYFTACFKREKKVEYIATLTVINLAFVFDLHLFPGQRFTQSVR